MQGQAEDETSRQRARASGLRVSAGRYELPRSATRVCMKSDACTRVGSGWKPVLRLDTPGGRGCADTGPSRPHPERGGSTRLENARFGHHRGRLFPHRSDQRKSRGSRAQRTYNLRKITMTRKKPGGDRTAFQPRHQSSTGGGVMISQDRPWRKQPPEVVRDLAGIPRRKISDALREAVQANQSKRSKK